MSFSKSRIIKIPACEILERVGNCNAAYSFIKIMENSRSPLQNIFIKTVFITGQFDRTR